MPARAPKRESHSLLIVGVGASAGGLEAFTELLKHLPTDTGMGFVLVQHLDPMHESALTQLLARATSMPVREVTNNLRVEANHIYVIPPNASLGIAQSVLKLLPRKAARTPHRSIDAFFEALALDQRDRAIGVILSGTATDGTLGLEAIKAEGGITFAQDESARYDSMPRSAVAAGCVDFVLSPQSIAIELARIAKHPYVVAHPADPSAPRAQPEPAPDERDAESGFKKVLLLLRNHRRVDFSLYKSSTIRRRITRRVVLNKSNSVEDYADFLGDNSKELDALYSDVLIGVTSFFRNPEAFDVLKRKVFPKLLQQRGDDPLRIWVLGCSTGQEAYSMAMVFVEAGEKSSRKRRLQVFATDLNDALLDKARHALYPKSIAQEVSPERLRRFFVEEEGGYRVVKPLREMVVFARQNLISDPPFSRINLISCRNLLIYLDASLQKRAFPVFHYALKMGGFLFLGASESIGGFTALFEPVDKKHKIYSRKPTQTPALHLPAKEGRDERPVPGRSQPHGLFPPEGAPVEAPAGYRSELTAEREADRVTVNQFAPAGVLINSELQILQFRGATDAYLEPPTGKASFDVLKMAREGLMLPLRSAINKAKRENKTARQENVRVKRHGETRATHIEVIPLKNLRERCFLILFQEAEEAGRGVLSAPKRGPGRVPKSAGPAGRKVESRRLEDLEADLAEMRDFVQAIQEQHEAVNEELQASNEEVQSANEELQSTNEELETSKEELESANEELTTVNEEMAGRNTELSLLNSDLVNLQTSTRLAIVLLGRDLTIRRFSTEAAKLFNLLAVDVGRPIGSVRHNLVFEARRQKTAATLGALAAGVIDTVREDEHEVSDGDGRWFSLRVRPYFTLDNKVDGAVLVLVDITDLKRSGQAVAAARDYAEAIVRTARDPLLILSVDLRVHTANEAFYKTFKVSPAEAEGKLIYEIGNRQWDIPKLRELLENILPMESVFNNVEVTHDFVGLGRRTMLLNARRLSDPSGQPARILLGIEDVTEKLQFQVAVRESAEKFKLLFDRSPLPKWAFELETLRFVDANEAAVEHYGYSHEAFLRMNILDVYTPETGAALRAALTGPSHCPPELELCQHRKKSGEVIDVEVRGSEITLAGKRVWLVSIIDITEHKRAEEALHQSEVRFRELADAMPQIVWAARPDGRIDYFNQRWYEYTGFAESYEQEVWEAILHPDDVQRRLDSYFGCVRTGEPYHIEYRFKDRVRGGYRWFMGRALPIKNEAGEILRWFGTCVDIDNQKRLQEELSKRVEELAAIDRGRTDFLAVLSHELRTPLNAIRGWTQLLQRPDVSAEDLRQGLAVIDRNGRMQSDLIGDLLDVNRLTSGKIQLDVVELDLGAVINATIEGVLPDATAKGIGIIRDIEPATAAVVSGDGNRLQQVFGNLLANAIKFTPRQGEIRLALRCIDTRVEVTVSDTGAGINPEALPYLFERFRQADPLTSRGHGGLGLGLAIAKQLVELHGGRLAAQSAGKGQGATFTVTLPLRAIGAPKTLSEQVADATMVSLGGVVVLVVDNDMDAREPLRRVLEGAGAEVITAGSADEAMEIMQQQRPEVLVSDIGMPERDGYDLVRSIRALPPGRGGLIPIIALTAFASPGDRTRALRAGFDLHLAKPVEPAELLLAVESLARGRSRPLA